MSHPESFGNGSDSSESGNGSWVQLDESMKAARSVTTSPKFSDEDEVKDLLADAVEDHFKKSMMASNKEDASSVKVLQSPNETTMTSAEWVMNWSSRPEVVPKKQWIPRHPSAQKKGRMSLRRTKVMKNSVDLFKINMNVVIPSMMLSHALIFGIGFYIGNHLVAQKMD